MKFTFGNFIVIESGISGGSLALFRSGELADSFIGDGAKSRSEDLLPNLVSLLQNSGVTMDELSAIVVARGPGSFTGIRIGIATALGLGDSTGAAVGGASTLRAMSSLSDAKQTICALPLGRIEIATQLFLTPEASVHGQETAPAAGTTDWFADFADGNPEAEIVVHKHLLAEMKTRAGLKSRLIDAGENLADILGKSLVSSAISVGPPEPLYVSAFGANV